MKNNGEKYFLPCVKCPFCGEIVEAEVIETKTTKTIFCPACNVKKNYPIDNLKNK